MPLPKYFNPSLAVTATRSELFNDKGCFELTEEKVSLANCFYKSFPYFTRSVCQQLLNIFCTKWRIPKKVSMDIAPIQTTPTFVLLSFVSSVIPTLWSCKVLNLQQNCRHITDEPEILYSRLNKSSRLSYLLWRVFSTQSETLSQLLEMLSRSYIFNFEVIPGKINVIKIDYHWKSIFRDVSIRCVTLITTTALPVFTDRQDYFKQFCTLLLTTRPHEISVNMHPQY